MSECFKWLKVLKASFWGPVQCYQRSEAANTATPLAHSLPSMADDFQNVLVDLLKDLDLLLRAASHAQDAETKLLAAYEKQVAKLRASTVENTEQEVAKEGRDEGRAPD